MVLCLAWVGLGLGLGRAGEGPGECCFYAKAQWALLDHQSHPASG